MRVSVCVRGEAGFPIFFSDFVRPLTWLSSWECLSGSRHLGRVGISAAAAPAVPRQTCLGGVSWEPIRPSRSGCGSQTLPSCAASSAVTPSIGLVSSLLWVPGPRPPAVSPGAEASSHVVTPPAPSPILARKTPPSHWPDPGAPSPAPPPDTLACGQSQHCSQATVPQAVTSSLVKLGFELSSLHGLLRSCCSGARPLQEKSELE